MTKRITAFVSALLICFAMTGCGGSDEGSSKSGNNSPTTVPVTTDGADVTEAPETTEVTTTTTAAVAKTTEPTEATKAEEELDRSHFEPPVTPLTVSDGSGDTVIKTISYMAREGDGTVYVWLTFSIDSDHNKAKCFDYKLTDRSGTVAASGTVDTSGELLGDVISIREEIGDIPTPEIYTIIVEDHVQD